MSPSPAICPRCSGSNTRVLRGGYVDCTDCTAREIARTAAAERLAFRAEMDEHIRARRQFRQALGEGYSGGYAGGEE